MPLQALQDENECLLLRAAQLELGQFPEPFEVLSRYREINRPHAQMVAI